MGFILKNDKCQFEPTLMFTHLGLKFNTREMTISLPGKKVQTIKTQATTVTLLPMYRGVMTLGLANFASMALPLARLHSQVLWFWLKQTYWPPANLFKAPLDLDLLRITPKAIQVTADLLAFQLVFGAKNAHDCLCPVVPIKKYLARIKNRKQRSEKVFVTRNLSSAMVAKWLKEMLTIANIRALGESTRKAATSYAASQGVSIMTIIENGDLAHPSTMYGYFISAYPRQVLVRSIEGTSGSIQGVNIAATATDNPVMGWGHEPHCDACPVRQRDWRYILRPLEYTFLP